MKKITRIGVGGPVGSGKTAIIEAVTPVLIRRGIKPLDHHQRRGHHRRRQARPA